jgi:hypothetical protein
MSLTKAAIERYEALNRERLEDWWERIGEEPAYPASTETVLRLLDAVEYRVSNAVFHDYRTNNLIVCPARPNGCYEWSASEIVSFARALEARRQWKPFSTLHDHKKTEFQRAKEMADKLGVPPMNDIANRSAEDLLLLMVESDDRGAREAIYTALQWKREQEEKAERIHAGN